jgi:hypothetical protein
MWWLQILSHAVIWYRRSKSALFTTETMSLRHRKRLYRNHSRITPDRIMCSEIRGLTIAGVVGSTVFPARTGVARSSHNPKPMFNPSTGYLLEVIQRVGLGTKS